ncbi:MAG: DNA-3-methyladenine glycosylase, partial [Candidatus Pacebacteria bacterium]|nr:DNA-3-methyladenine glycosylase [Candidatus Paceibacterota bacterium]
MTGMLMKKEDFLSKNTPVLAKNLLGKILVRKIGNKEMRAVIFETEAYGGFLDKASHAYKGKTERNEIMFQEAGNWYVYFIYGKYFMLNLVTGPVRYPAAILIRGVEILPERKRVDGPGRLTKFLRIDKNLNGKAIEKKSGLWIESSGIKIKSKDIKSLPRVGI